MVIISGVPIFRIFTVLYGVYISQHVLFAGMSSLVTVFYARNKILIAELSVS